MIDIIATSCIMIFVPHLNGEAGSTRFINIVTNDPHGAPSAHLIQNIQTPYIDPPIGSWSYEPLNTNDDIYYWDSDVHSENSIYKHTDTRQTQFIDCPSDPRLKQDETINFTTLIVNSNTKEILHVVDWSLDYQRKTTVIFSGDRELEADIKKLISPWELER
jgi:hypothetical protein